MDFPTLLVELRRRRITLAEGPDGTTAIEGPPRSIDDDLAAELASHKVLLRWTVVAEATGHEWRVCDTCCQYRLARVGRRLSCSLTARCRGELVPLDRLDPAMTEGSAA